MASPTNELISTGSLRAVADASFLIGISICRQWETLESLVDTLIVADEVWTEVVARGKGRPGAGELQGANFVARRTVSNSAAVALLSATLGKGEAATLVLATELGVKSVFLDDRRGRKFAQTLGLKTIGVVGFLLFAKKGRKIEEIQPLLFQLKQKGFRLSDKLIAEILKEAGETL